MIKIVVVDDCLLTQQIAHDILEEAGYQVATADSVIEANRHVFSSPRPRLLLIDVEMPLLSGDRAVRFFRERESSRDIPILLISSKSPEILAKIAEDAGAAGYICKPLDPKILLTTIARILAPPGNAVASHNYRK